MSDDREVTPLERVIDILADAKEELAADNAAAAEVSRRRDLERVLGDQSIAQQFDDMRHELARIAVALGRSIDGTGFDCDWHELAADVEEALQDGRDLAVAVIDGQATARQAEELIDKYATAHVRPG